MSQPRWLLPEVVVAVHRVLITDHGGLSGIRDVALLESALSRPQQLLSYGGALGIPQLAAAYCYGLARNHPFIDGNKRVALTAAGLFIEINGHELTASEADAVLIIEELAAGQVKEKELAAWFSDRTKKKNEAASE